MNGKRTKRMSRPTALAIHLRDDGVMDGCNHYRFRIPFEMIRDRVNRSFLDWAPIGKVREWAGNPKADVKPTDYDMLVLPRHRPLPYSDDDNIPEWLFDRIAENGIDLERTSHLLDLAEVLGRRQSIVLEYDDDYWTGSRDLGYAYPELLHKLLQTVDAVTVSTPHLRRLVQQYAPGKPCYILPNCVNFAEWQGWDRWDRWPEDHVVLGLTGSITHYDDWLVLRDVLPRIMKEQGNVALVLSGFVPDYLGVLEAMYPDRVYTNTEFVDYYEYPGLIRQADITLCPVEPTDEFNLSKSGIKAIEGMAAGRQLSNGKTGGAGIVASPLDYYKRVVGKNRGIVVKEHTPDHWYEAITKLITNRRMRETMGFRGRKWVYRNRAIEFQWGQWWDAYREIHRRKRK